MIVRLRFVCLFHLIYISLSAVPSKSSNLIATSALQALDVLSPKSTCIRTSLNNLLPACKIDNLESIERIYYAIRLSICEFDASGINYPPTCNIGNIPSNHLLLSQSLHLCTSDLESRSQWWTTYSGNYKFIGLLCTENQKSYETQSTIWLFKNITNIYLQLFDELDNAYNEIALKRDLSHDLNVNMIDLQYTIKLFETSCMEVMNKINLQFNDLSLEISKLHHSASQLSLKHEALHDSSIQLFQYHLDLSYHIQNLEKYAGSLQNKINVSHTTVNELHASQLQLTHEIENQSKAIQQIFSSIKLPNLSRIRQLILLGIATILICLVHRQLPLYTIFYMLTSLTFLLLFKRDLTAFTLIAAIGIMLLTPRVYPIQTTAVPSSESPLMLELFY